MKGVKQQISKTYVSLQLTENGCMTMTRFLCYQTELSNAFYSAVLWTKTITHIIERQCQQKNCSNIESLQHMNYLCCAQLTVFVLSPCQLVMCKHTWVKQNNIFREKSVGTTKVKFHWKHHNLKNKLVKTTKICALHQINFKKFGAHYNNLCVFKSWFDIRLVISKGLTATSDNNNLEAEVCSTNNNDYNFTHRKYLLCTAHP